MARPERAAIWLLLLAQQLVDGGVALALFRSGDALARGRFTLSPADAALVVRIEAATLVAAGVRELELGRLVCLRS